MKFVQRLLKLFLPGKTFEAVMIDSGKWFFICPECGNKKPFPETGAVRYKAANTRKRALGKCPQCNKWKMFRIEKVESERDMSA